MIMCDLPNLTATQLVQAGVPNMTHGDLTVFNNGDGQNTSHSLPAIARLGLAKDFVVGHRDRFTNAVAQAAGLSFKPGAHSIQRNFGSSFAGGLTAYAVNHQENASLGIDVKTIFVVGPQKTRMSFTGASECGC